MATRYLPEILYTIALTSLSTHMLWLRKESEDQRAYWATRIKVLEDTAQRLRVGQSVPQSDFDLIQKMAREPGSDRAVARGIEPTDHLGWREVFLGRGGSQSALLDQKDWEDAKKEMERS